MLSGLLLGSYASYADDTFTVTTVADTNTGTGSLRDAINSANITSLADEVITADSEVLLVTRNNGSYDRSWLTGPNGIAPAASFEVSADLTIPDNEWSTLVTPNGVQFDFSLCFPNP